jgi:hypothetical protein
MLLCTNDLSADARRAQWVAFIIASMQVLEELAPIQQGQHSFKRFRLQRDSLGRSCRGRQEIRRNPLLLLVLLVFLQSQCRRLKLLNLQH